jgi:protein-S-isoprenylcysteine O-methyltransferase Ste14
MGLPAVSGSSLLVPELKLLDHFTGSGGTLFRWRSYVPLVLLPAFLLSLAGGGYLFGSRNWDRAWGLGCLALSLAGLAIRVWTIGTAPAGTSERSTTAPRATTLSTAGVYSIVRHPLYLGNSIIALGMACFSRTWYLPVIVALASLLYHERICAREEAFLEERFGDDFRAWATRVPALVPRFGYEPAREAFRWTRVLGREFHALVAIGASFFVLDVIHESLVRGSLFLDPLWTWISVVTGVIFIVLTLLKRAFGLFR